MKQWALWQNQLVKWPLFYIESYIVFMMANIIFTVSFDETFDFPVAIIWMIFLLLSLFTTFIKEIADFGIYLLLGIFFLIGVFAYQLPFVIWGGLLLYMLWRFNVVQEKDITYEEYFKVILIYILTTIIYFGLNIMYQKELPINVVQSYLIIFLLLLLGGVLMQLKGSVFSKKLVTTIVIQVIMIVLMIGLLIILFPFIKPFIILILTFLKNIFSTLWLLIATFIYNILLSKIRNNEEQGDDLLEKLKGNSEANEEQAVQDIPEYFNPEIMHYLGIIISVIAIISIIIGMIYFVKQRKTNKLGSTQLVEAYIGNDKQPLFSKKNRSVLSFSANYYRKLYQKYLIWLVKKKMLEIDRINTSVEIKNKLISKYPDIEQDIEILTTNYQLIRYGNQEPTISKKEFKELINRLKKAIKSM